MSVTSTVSSTSPHIFQPCIQGSKYAITSVVQIPNKRQLCLDSNSYRTTVARRITPFIITSHSWIHELAAHDIYRNRGRKLVQSCWISDWRRWRMWKATSEKITLGQRSNERLAKRRKAWDLSVATKIGLVQALVISVATYGCEMWPLNKAQITEIRTFKQWCCRKLLRTNESVESEVGPEMRLDKKYTPHSVISKYIKQLPI